MSLSGPWNHVLPIALVSAVLAGYLAYEGISLLWVLPLLGLIAVLAPLATLLKRHVKSPAGRKGVNVGL